VGFSAADDKNPPTDAKNGFAGLQNQDGRARGEISGIYQQLSYEQIKHTASRHPPGNYRAGTERDNVR
jgi:hypothetical protein